EIWRDAHIRVERHALRQIADAPAYLERLAEDVVAGHLRAAAAGGHEARKDPHRRRLTGAVGAEEAHDLTGRDAERHVADRGDGAVVFGEILNFDHPADLRLYSRRAPGQAGTAITCDVGGPQHA